MDEYNIRSATEKDILFLADVVMCAEKGISDKLSFSTLFDLEEAEARDFIISMFEEEIDGCEFSVSSFQIVEYQDAPVAAFGGWIEGLSDGLPSKILKSNLMSFTFGMDNILKLQPKAEFLKSIMVEREPSTLQLEYLYVLAAHRGKGLTGKLINQLESAAIATFPNLKKVQVQVFSNNISAINAYKKNGFAIGRIYHCENADIFNYLPHNEKYLMEKNLTI